MAPLPTVSCRSQKKKLHSFAARLTPCTTAPYIPEFLSLRGILSPKGRGILRRKARESLALEVKIEGGRRRRRLLDKWRKRTFHPASAHNVEIIAT